MPVSKNQRALVLVNAVSKQSGVGEGYTVPMWNFMYSFAENSAVGVTQTVLGDDYKFVTVRKGSNATKAKFLNALKSAATTAGIKAVDVFLLLHGDKTRLHFWDAKHEASVLRDNILNLNLTNLRLLYSTACFGNHTNWREMFDAGFVTTIGARGQNCTGATEFPSFCGMWQHNAKVRDIMPVADNAATRAIQDAAAKALDPLFKDANSKKQIHGNENLAISTSV